MKGKLGPVEAVVTQLSLGFTAVSGLLAGFPPETAALPLLGVAWVLARVKERRAAAGDDETEVEALRDSIKSQEGGA
jgi:hypothetical protein